MLERSPRTRQFVFGWIGDQICKQKDQHKGHRRPAETPAETQRKEQVEGANVKRRFTQRNNGFASVRYLFAGRIHGSSYSRSQFELDFPNDDLGRR